MKKALILLLLAAAASGCAYHRPDSFVDAASCPVWTEGTYPAHNGGGIYEDYCGGGDGRSCPGGQIALDEYGVDLCVLFADNVSRCVSTCQVDTDCSAGFTCEGARPANSAASEVGAPGFCAVSVPFCHPGFRGQVDASDSEPELSESEAHGILCNDGTYSPTCYTARSGCCSHHGGIAR